jgi:hypothetical protein
VFSQRTCATTEKINELKANNPSFGCPTFPDNTDSCNPTTEVSIVMNYMDYVNDTCMAFFTTGQKKIMRNALNGPMASLLRSNSCASLGLDEVGAIQAIAVYPNPVSQYFIITSPHTFVDFIEFYNVNGQLEKHKNLKNIIIKYISKI